MKILHAAVALLAAGTVAATGAEAKQGDVIVRVRAIDVMPQEDAGAILPALPSSSVKVNNTITPEIDFTYMVADNVGLELIAATSRHTVTGVGPVVGGVDVLKTNALPPTLTLQYHFAPDGKVRPYAGAGVNYTTFFNSKATSAFESVAGNTDIKMKKSFGWALQAGVDVPLNDRLFLNLDAKYIKIDTKATLTTANLGTQAVKVDLNPIVVGVGIGTKF